MTKPIIRCGFGIGNRVTMMANALSRHDEIAFLWRQNPQVQLWHDEVFPNGIPGVEFTDVKLGFATRWARDVPGESWEASDNYERSNAAYRTIMDAMAGAAWTSCPVAIVARFWRFPHANAERLAETAAEHGSEVFVLADSRREEIVARLESLGVKAILPIGPEMKCDLDRTPKSMLTYFSDWKTAIRCGSIVTHHEETAVTYPARALGKPIITPQNAI